MPSKEIIVTHTSQYSGPLNPAITTWHYNPVGGITLPAFMARILGFYKAWGTQWSEGGVNITGMQQKDDGVPGVYDMGWPQSAITDLNTALGVQLVTETNWPMPYHPAPSASSGRGDSLCMNLKAGGTRSKHGRIFLPFLTREAISDEGLIKSANQINIQSGMGFYFLGEASAGVTLPAASFVVYSKKLLSAAAVQSVKVSLVPSRLRTRTK